MQGLKKLLEKYVDTDGLELTEDTLILRDLGLNSYSLIELAGDIEDEYGVEFDDSQLAKIKTVGDVLRLINSGS